MFDAPQETQVTKDRPLPQQVELQLQPISISAAPLFVNT